MEKNPKNKKPFTAKKTPNSDCFIGELYQTAKEVIIPMLHKSLRR